MSDKDIIDMKEENGQWSAYVSDFSPEKLWGKIKGHAKKVGCEAYAAPCACSTRWTTHQCRSRRKW